MDREMFERASRAQMAEDMEIREARELEAPAVVYLREADAGTANACWIVCAKGDPGSIRFVAQEG